MTPDFQMIETLSQLESLSKRLSQEKVLAFDMEADSLHHYFPKVCLIQTSTVEETFLIDPLTIRTIDPLRPVLENNRIVKVFHGGDYDLRSIYRDYAIQVHNVFDTMIASQFLGEKEVGLAAALKKRFGVLLNKKYQRANWSKRPLPHDMLFYAAQDTAHLIAFYRELRRELERKGRLAWVDEECELLPIECTTGVRSSEADSPGEEVGDGSTAMKSPPKTPLFKRFKGAGTLAPRDLAVLEGLLAFREKRAMQQDRPPFKLFGNTLIKTLVQEKPTDYADLSKLPHLPADFMRRYAKGALRAIKEGLALPENRLPTYPRTPRPPRNFKKQDRLKRLKKWRDTKARELQLEAGLICNNVLLSALAEAHPKAMDGLESIAGMRAWQKKALGREIIQTLDGAGVSSKAPTAAKEPEDNPAN